MKTLGNAMVKRQILERIATLHPEARPRWGKMNAHQMLCHLSDSFRFPLGEKDASPATGLAQRTVMKWFALYVPMRWPKGVPTRPEMEQGCGGTPPADFPRDRADLIRTLERFAAPKVNFSSKAHPLFGELKHQEWLRWGYLHADHHLRQFGV